VDKLNEWKKKHKYNHELTEEEYEKVLVHLKEEIDKNKSTGVDNFDKIKTLQDVVANNRHLIVVNEETILDEKEIAFQNYETNRNRIDRNDIVIADNEYGIVTNEENIHANRKIIIKNEDEIALNRTDIATNRIAIVENEEAIGNNLTYINTNKRIIRDNERKKEQLQKDIDGLIYDIENGKYKTKVSNIIHKTTSLLELDEFKGLNNNVKKFYTEKVVTDIMPTLIAFFNDVLSDNNIPKFLDTYDVAITEIAKNGVKVYKLMMDNDSEELNDMKIDLYDLFDMFDDKFLEIVKANSSYVLENLLPKLVEKFENDLRGLKQYRNPNKEIIPAILDYPKFTKYDSDDVNDLERKPFKMLNRAVMLHQKYNFNNDSSRAFIDKRNLDEVFSEKYQTLIHQKYMMQLHTYLNNLNWFKKTRVTKYTKAAYDKKYADDNTLQIKQPPPPPPQPSPRLQQVLPPPPPPSPPSPSHPKPMKSLSNAMRSKLRIAPSTVYLWSFNDQGMVENMTNERFTYKLGGTVLDSIEGEHVGVLPETRAGQFGIITSYNKGTTLEELAKKHGLTISFFFKLTSRNLARGMEMLFSTGETGIHMTKERSLRVRIRGDRQDHHNSPTNKVYDTNKWYYVRFSWNPSYTYFNVVTVDTQSNKVVDNFITPKNIPNPYHIKKISRADHNFIFNNVDRSDPIIFDRLHIRKQFFRQDQLQTSDSEFGIFSSIPRVISQSTPTVIKITLDSSSQTISSNSSNDKFILTSTHNAPNPKIEMIGHKGKPINVFKLDHTSKSGVYYNIQSTSRSVLSYVNENKSSEDKGYTVSYFVRIPYGFYGYYSFSSFYRPVGMSHSYNGQHIHKLKNDGGFESISMQKGYPISSKWCYVRSSMRYDDNTKKFTEGSLFIKELETNKVIQDYDDNVQSTDPTNLFFSMSVNVPKGRNMGGYNFEFSNITFRNKYITGKNELPTKEVWGDFYEGPVSSSKLSLSSGMSTSCAQHITTIPDFSRVEKFGWKIKTKMTNKRTDFMTDTILQEDNKTRINSDPWYYYPNHVLDMTKPFTVSMWVTPGMMYLRINDNNVKNGPSMKGTPGITLQMWAGPRSEHNRAYFRLENGTSAVYQDMYQRTDNRIDLVHFVITHDPKKRLIQFYQNTQLKSSRNYASNLKLPTKAYVKIQPIFNGGHRHTSRSTAWYGYKPPWKPSIDDNHSHPYIGQNDPSLPNNIFHQNADVRICQSYKTKEELTKIFDSYTNYL